MNQNHFLQEEASHTAAELRLPTHRLHPSLVAVDLDGTFLDEHSGVSPAHAEVVQELRLRGIPFCLATGRLPARLPPAVRELEALEYGVFCNGGSVRQAPNWQALSCLALDREDVRKALLLLEAHQIYYEAYTGGQPYTSERVNLRYSPDFYTPAKRKTMDQARHILSEEAFSHLVAEEPIEKIFMPYVPAQQEPELWKQIRMLPGICPTASGPGTMELNVTGCTKAGGLLTLARLLGLDPMQILVFGDAGNDADMLQTFPLSVAMGNATPEVRAMARFDTLSNAEDGVAWFLRRFVLDERKEEKEI